ncbi:MAG: phosphate ABC transporter substrate-binding/OmpA family protein [Pseudomonadota bacterium]
MLRLLIAALCCLPLHTPAWAADIPQLRLHGSNTIGAELAPELVKAWLDEKGYSSIRQSTSAPQEMVINAVSPAGKRVAVTIKAHGSSTSFKAINRGEADIGMASRPIKTKEVAMLSRFGKMNSYDSEFVVGLDGIAVIVHPNNPLQQLYKDQLRRIFSGEVTDWSEFGLDSAPIHVYARDDKSGTYDTFKHLVLGKRHPLVNGARRFESNANLSDAVSQDPNGIGFVGLPYVNQSKALSVADGEARSVAPTAFTVATEDYVLARRLFLYLPEATATPAATDFIQFAVSQAGQEVVNEVGFVSQNVIADEVEHDKSAPEEYRALTEGAERLSLNFRFQPGTINLDNKAHRDVERLKQYLELPENRKRELMLFGFADSNETMPYVTLLLSTGRADVIADLLIKEGLSPHKVRGYGDAVPVASNETNSGRAKNRRVEVWLR